MAKGGPAVAVIFYDDSPGGTPRNISTGLRTIGGIGVDEISEKNTPFGQSFDSNTPVGVQTMADNTMGGDFDTTPTTGTHAVFGTPDNDPNGGTRTLTVRPLGTGTGLPEFNIETRNMGYTVQLKTGALTQFQAKVVQAGAGAWSVQS